MTGGPIPTKDVPQADTLDKVLLTVDAVSNGYTKFQEIAQYIGVVERQGRYYRRAAEILDLITKKTSNESSLTQTGITYLNSNTTKKREITIDQVLKAGIFQTIINFLLASGGSTNRKNLETIITKSVTETTPNMVHRRLSTILSWLSDLGLIEIDNQKIKLLRIPNSIEKLEISNIDLPILPQPNDLKTYEEILQRRKTSNQIIKFEINSAKFDRANQTHELLRSILAKKIKNQGVLPTFNKYIDLAVKMDDVDYLIEVKTSTKHVRNQIRKAVSQLYEYRYLQNLPDAKLVLLIEKPITGNIQWMLDYLVKDREIFVVWDGKDEELFTTDEGLNNLPFMMP